LTPASRSVRALKRGAALRLITAAACFSLCFADANGYLIYWPSGRGATTFERVGHGLLMVGGFLVGTLFCITALISVARLWKLQTRLRGGLCPTCGYDLRASPGPCPECGSFASRPAG
jgi:hypothetical protein